MVGPRLARFRGLGLVGVLLVVGSLLETASASVSFIPSEINWQSMTVDEILFKSNNIDTTFVPSATVRMDVVGGFLYVELTNTSEGDETKNDSGNILDGLGFVLPNGVSLNQGTTKSNNDLELGSGASLLGSGTLGSEKWGLGNADSGHFDSPTAGGNGPAVLTYNSVLSTFIPDTDETLTGQAATVLNIGTFDYGLKSRNAGSGPAGGPGDNTYVEDQLVFKLELFGSSIDRDAVLNSIEASAVGVVFDSPKVSSTPEPSTLVVWSLLGAVAITVGWWRRKRRTL